jgi:dethiobiotin synthetase
MNDLPGLFVVGTDTGVGKTRVASAIARTMTLAGKRVGVLKPVMTGVASVARHEGGGCPTEMDDADHLMAAVGGTVPKSVVCPITYSEPLAPPIAARRLGAPLLVDDVLAAVSSCLDKWRNILGAEVMVVEGVGGLLCPLAEGITVADLAVRLDYPLVVVARRGLGTLNNTLLTVEAALARSLRVAGVVLNGSEPTADPVAESTNPFELARRLGTVPILAEVPYGADGGSAAVALDRVDWYNRASGPRLLFPMP